MSFSPEYNQTKEAIIRQLYLPSLTFSGISTASPMMIPALKIHFLQKICPNISESKPKCCSMKHTELWHVLLRTFTDRNLLKHLRDSSLSGWQGTLVKTHELQGNTAETCHCTQRTWTSGRKKKKEIRGVVLEKEQTFSQDQVKTRLLMLIEKQPKAPSRGEAVCLSYTLRRRWTWWFLRYFKEMQKKNTIEL